MSFVRFGLIVTGRGEEKFLPTFFGAIMRSANCRFQVIRRSGQLNPITSPKRLLSMTGRGKMLPTIDEEQFGLPARSFLRKHQNSFVLVIDDLEGDRAPQVAEVFTRYRRALDEILGRCGLSDRAAVHFLVNMLEAYYFAHADAVNSVAGDLILPSDHADDVEAIAHPKNRLKGLWANFNEVEHGSGIIQALDLNHVLARPGHCCSLRTMFAWCIDRLRKSGAIWDPQLHDAFQLSQGCRFEITRHQ